MSRETARILGGMKGFESKFWRRVQAGGPVSDIMNKIASERRNRVVRLLEVITEPGFEKRLKWEAKKIDTELFKSFFQPAPPRKELRGLARRLQTIGRDLERVFGAGGISYKSALFLRLSADCRSRARDLKYLDWARLMDLAPRDGRRILTFKAFWGHLPVGVLCRELKAPKVISFVQVEVLLRCAYSLHGRTWTRPKRSIEREYKGFMRSRSTNPTVRTSHTQTLGKLFDAVLDLATK